MGIDIAKLEKVKRKGAGILARCPACAEEGHDRKGEHLFIGHNGRFGCVLYPGTAGLQHRQRIFVLVGIKEENVMRNGQNNPLSKVIEIKALFKEASASNIIQKNILGHLGRLSLTHTQKNIIEKKEQEQRDVCKDLKTSVPTVPNESSRMQNGLYFTPQEEKLLEGINAEDFEKIRYIKQIFHGTVIVVKEEIK